MKKTNLVEQSVAKAFQALAIFGQTLNENLWRLLSFFLVKIEMMVGGFVDCYKKPKFDF